MSCTDEHSRIHFLPGLVSAAHRRQTCHAHEARSSLPNATPKAYCEVDDGDHFFPNANTPNQPTSKFQIAWIKRFADGDARYTQFVNTAGITAELNAGRLSDARIESF